MIYINFTRPDGPRRNLLTYTEQFDDAAWTKSRSSIATNTILSPDGTLTAEKLVEDTSNNTHVVFANEYLTTNTILTASVYAKPNERSAIILQISNFLTGSAFAFFNLLTGTFSASSSGDYTNTIASITPVGNGWFRCTITTTKGNLNSVNRFLVELHNGTSNSYTGDGTSGLHIWGAQLEVGGPTEYQPVVSGLEFSIQPLNHARIGYQNLASGLTPTASTAAAGHPAISATYPTTFEFWTPTALPATWAVDLGSAKTVDYFGMVGDMNGCTIALQSSTDNSTWTTQDTRTSITDRINMFLILPVTARYWRLSISVAIPLLSVVYLGQALAMQRKIYQGHTPLTLSRETELSNNMSEGGQYLGRSIIRKGASTSADWQHLRADWYRANFDPFVESAREYPFFIGWRPEQYPNELGFVWTGGDISPQNTGPRDFMSVGMSFRGLINE